MGLIKFSANLGFLWTELNLPSAILAAKAAGFDAVECHWPYDTDPKAIIGALQDTNFTMIGLNTRRGDVGTGENGLSALPGREDDAKDARSSQGERETCLSRSWSEALRLQSGEKDIVRYCRVRSTRSEALLQSRPQSDRPHSDSARRQVDYTSHSR